MKPTTTQPRISENTAPGSPRGVPAAAVILPGAPPQAAVPWVLPAVLSKARLNVTDKVRSNIFSWRGQFTPQFVEYLLDAFAKPTDLVLDPFCGSGTVLLEAARKNIRSAGCEISPAAYAMAKFIALSNLPIDERQSILQSTFRRIDKLLTDYDTLPLIADVPSFRGRYKSLLDFARDLFEKAENKRDLLLSVVVLFHAEKNGKASLGHSVKQACRAVEGKLLSLPYTSAEVTAKLSDARAAHSFFRQAADLIITSPPYINVFNYHQNYRAVLEVLGYDLLKVAGSEIGSNRRNRGNRFRTVVQYALEMEQALISLAECLKTSGTLVLVIGRESCVRKISFSNSEILRAMADRLGCFKQESRDERVFTNRFGLRIKEDILVLRRITGKPTGGSARAIVREHLETALRLAGNEQREGIREVLRALNTIQASPLLSRKGII